ncbi:MAG TPA: enoyl-CoA hydratase-related protein, partial [Bryobacteraceae bacterium]|nr:enoyl-CoA hydratase-related protein [Bryobacteraceae bacterium]
ACDLAVASEEASFATPGVRIGMFCTTPAVPLVRAIGRKRALQMLLTGEPIDARTAEAWGLVNTVVPAGQLRTTTLELSRQIAEASVDTVTTGKRAFYDNIDLPETQAYENAKYVMTASAMCPDAQEGITAFLEKRRPTWSK